MSLKTNIDDCLSLEYHNFFPWYSISFIVGIVLSFNYSYVIPLTYITFALIIIAIIIYLIYQNIVWQFLFILIFSLIFGILISQYRMQQVKNFDFDQEIVTQISAIITTIKPTVRGAQVTLKDIEFDNQVNFKLDKVRIAMPETYLANLKVNDKIKILTKFYPPNQNILPNGYDFSFFLKYDNIGAVGYALSVPIILESTHRKSLINNLREKIYKILITNLGKVEGNFAAAIILGETKALDRKIMQNMRFSGASHILCVSGLHLSLIAGIFFISSRFLINLFDFLAYQYDIKKIAAIISLIGSFFYLEISGMQIAATRAYIMTGIFTIGIIVGRTPSPLRSIAFAVFIILGLNPEFVFHPSFQLSFIAVLSLVIGFEFYTKYQWLQGKGSGIFYLTKTYLISNIYSSFLASILTAPVVIYHFYTFANYSIPMNLLVVPIMSFILMPLAIISLILMPLNLSTWPLFIMGKFIAIVIYLAKFFTNLPNSISYFGYITPFSLVIFLFGFFTLSFWHQTKLKFFGIGIMIISILMMSLKNKPDIMIDTEAEVVAIHTKNELNIISKKMSKFNQDYWANWFGFKKANYIKKNVANYNYLFNLGYRTIAVNFNAKYPRIGDIIVNLYHSDFRGLISLTKDKLEYYSK